MRVVSVQSTSSDTRIIHPSMWLDDHVHDLRAGVVDHLQPQRGRIDPGFDGGLVTAQLGLGIGQSAPGLLEGQRPGDPITKERRHS